MLRRDDFLLLLLAPLVNPAKMDSQSNFVLGLEITMGTLHSSSFFFPAVFFFVTFIALRRSLFNSMTAPAKPFQAVNRNLRNLTPPI